ncbi:MAG: class I SAM-dependent methyltransferase [Acidobacteria bacterium]|nr:MAG: class I SAM-dependent methyltransferase [Acidobacteriota bacterium]
MRFSGPIGTLLAETQEALLLSSVPGLEGRSVLDVGTGTGRAALVFARGGGRVTGVDASAQMLEVARERAAAEGSPSSGWKATLTRCRFPTAPSTQPSAFASSCTPPTGGAASASCAASRVSGSCSIIPHS